MACFGQISVIHSSMWSFHYFIVDWWTRHKQKFQMLVVYIKLTMLILKSQKLTMSDPWCNWYSGYCDAFGVIVRLIYAVFGQFRCLKPTRTFQFFWYSVYSSMFSQFTKNCIISFGFALYLQKTSSPCWLKTSNYSLFELTWPLVLCRSDATPNVMTTILGNFKNVLE